MAIDRIVREAFQLVAKSVREKNADGIRLEKLDAQGIRCGGNIRGGGAGHCGERACQRSALWTYGGVGGADSRGRCAVDGCLGKKKTAGSVYYDITWMAYVGAKVPEKFAKIFEVVREAREAATELIRKHISAGKPLQGWQVDKAARRVIEKAGYGKYFFTARGIVLGKMFTATA